MQKCQTDQKKIKHVKKYEKTKPNATLRMQRTQDMLENKTMNHKKPLTTNIPTPDHWNATIAKSFLTKSE